MRLFESPGTIKRFRRTAWEFQQTFQTPLQDLARFLDVIMSASSQPSVHSQCLSRSYSNPATNWSPCTQSTRSRRNGTAMT